MEVTRPSARSIATTTSRRRLLVAIAIGMHRLTWMTLDAQISCSEPEGPTAGPAIAGSEHVPLLYGSYNCHVHISADDGSRQALDELRRAADLEAVGRPRRQHARGTGQTSFVVRPGIPLFSGPGRTAAYRQRMRRTV